MVRRRNAGDLIALGSVKSIVPPLPLKAECQALIEEGMAAGPKRKAFLFVNNRLEGKAILAIATCQSFSFDERRGLAEEKVSDHPIRPIPPKVTTVG